MIDAADQKRVEILAQRLGLPAGDINPELALEALRHGSFVHERSLAPGKAQLRSNERLEFLGDAILGFVIARRAYERFPQAAEGDLTRLRASLVREESLALVARQMGLGDLLLLGRGEQRSGGRENATRLADALEAVIAAVYLSCGMDRAQEVVERILAPLFAQTEALARDPKTELQQLFQSRRRVPQYHVQSVTGPDHARTYEVEVRLDLNVLGRGSGRSKKEAEQSAARAALESRAALEQALQDEPVTLVEPDPAWPAIAAEELARLRTYLPEATGEHVGSTAVSGLGGRPIVDLMFGVRELPGVLRLGDYEFWGEAGTPGRLLFRKRGNGQGFNVQLVVMGQQLWQDALLLRDYLASHPEDAAHFCKRKRELLAAGANTLLHYAREKGPVLAELISRARRSLEPAAPLE
jgi:ribonuclease-3